MGKRDHDLAYDDEYQPSHPPKPETPKERVEYVADLMASGRWRRRVTSRELAEAWGQARDTIDGYAKEAHRLLMIPTHERDERRAELAAKAMAIADKAESRPNLVTGLPDYGSALKAMELFAKYSGIDVETHVRVTVEREIDIVMARLERRLPPDIYEQVLEASRAGDDDVGTLGGSSPYEVSRLALPAAVGDVDGSD